MATCLHRLHMTADERAQAEAEIRALEDDIDRRETNVMRDEAELDNRALCQCVG